MREAIHRREIVHLILIFKDIYNFFTIGSINKVDQLNPSDLFFERFILDIENNHRLSNENIVRTIVLKKQTFNQLLGFDIIIRKHRLYPINGVFIEHIEGNSLADL